MKRFVLRILISIILIIMARGNVWSFEKVGTTSFQFLKVMTDARSTGMGEAYTSVVRASDGVFWNPAALTGVLNFDATISYLDYLLDISHSAVSAAFSIKKLGTIGFQGILTNIGEIEVTNVDNLGFVGNDYNPGLTGETIQPGHLVLGATFARQFTNKLAFGLTVKYMREDLSVQAKSTFAFDMGLLFNTGFRSLQLAAVIRHFGPEVKYVGKSFPLPQTFTLGISSYLLAPDNAMLFMIPKHSLLVSYDLAHPRDYNQQHHVGMEYGFHDFIFLRTGYKLNYDEEGLTFGFGIKKGFLRIDYSYADFGDYFNAVNRFTVGFAFSS